MKKLIIIAIINPYRWRQLSMELVVIPAILAFIVTCFCWIKARPWTDPAMKNKTMKNKVKYFFQVWGVLTISFATFCAFAYKLS